MQRFGAKWKELKDAAVAVLEPQFEVENSMKEFRADQAERRVHELKSKKYLASHITKLENIVEG